jgi:hypothetical protein
VLPPARKKATENHCGRNLEKINGGGSGLSQKWTLKMQLKIGGRTGTGRKDRPQMLQGLQQGFSPPADRRGLFAAEPGTQTIQLPAQLAPQPIDRFQGEGQPRFFSGGFERKSRQHFHQPAPHQRSRQGVPWQNISQDNGKSPSTTAAPPAIGTKYPLAPNTLAAGFGRIVAT